MRLVRFGTITFDLDKLVYVGLTEVMGGSNSLGQPVEGTGRYTATVYLQGRIELSFDEVDTLSLMKLLDRAGPVDVIRQGPV